MIQEVVGEDCGPVVGGAAGVTAGYQVVWRKHMLFRSERGEQQRRPFHLLPVGGEWRQ